jgi:hypothetical protein
MTGRTAPSTDGLQSQVFLSCKAGNLCTLLGMIPLSPLSLATDVTLRASGLWPGTQTGAGGTATLA